MLRSLFLIALSLQGTMGDSVTLHFDSHRGGEKQVALSKGRSIKVVLPGNPTTGYSWTEDAVPSTFVKPLKAGYVTSQQPGARPMMGAGGRFEFEYEALQPGRAELKFVYVRPWEASNPSADRSHATVVLDIAADGTAQVVNV
eukprot:GDKI01014737.1.p1 GENE.GDKI01014737.1~~GDKI01014737.1.p1  ORF type:complete len:162 (-),score=21.11 GDKI01014737.1:383-811(-)